MSFSVGISQFGTNFGNDKNESNMQTYEYDDEMMNIGDSLQITPSALEVDYDKNLTELYQAITDQDWNRAASVCRNDPAQAATWVVRHYNDDNDENVSASVKSPEQEPEIMWRFLPLHSACARQPPHSTVVALLTAYPDAAKCVDDQGMYALHYACGNQADESVIELLLKAFAKAAAIPDPRGMLPLHYIACWGPSPSAFSKGVLNKLIQAHPPALKMHDFDGNTPLDLAIDGDYPEKNAVASALRQWTKEKNLQTVTVQSSSSFKDDHSQKKPNKSKMLSIRQTNSHGSDYNDAIFVEQNVKIPLEPPASSSEDSSGNENKAAKFVVPSLPSVGPNLDSIAALLSKSESHESQGLPPFRSRSKSPPSVEPQQAMNRDVTSNKTVVSEMGYLVETVQSSSSVEVSGQNKGSMDFLNNVSSEVARASNERDIEHSSLLENFNDMKVELSEKIDHIAVLEQELKSIKLLLEESKLECSGLRQSLGDLMDEHEEVKRKSANTHDRLSSLSISLSSMKEQQSILSKIVTERNESCQATALKRKQLFDELLKMDMEDADAEGLIDASLRKHTREMEAISAVINAALD